MTWVRRVCSDDILRSGSSDERGGQNAYRFARWQASAFAVIVFPVPVHYQAFVHEARGKPTAAVQAGCKQRRADSEMSIESV